MKKHPIEAIAVGLRGCLRMELTNNDFVQIAVEHELPIIHVLGTKNKGPLYIAPSSEIVYFTRAPEELNELPADFIIPRDKFSMQLYHTFV